MKLKPVLLIMATVLAVFISFSALSNPVLTAESQTENTQEYLNMFNFLFRYVQDNYVEEIDPETLYMGAIKGLFESLDDPYSVYLTKNDMRLLRNTTTGRFGGVGLIISKPDPSLELEPTPRRPYPQYVEVVSPIEGAPAYRAGIHAGDHITAVEGESTEELTLDEVVDKLKGPPGTEVKVKILRRDSISFDVTITRAIIEVPTIKQDMIGNIAYLRIVDWTPYTDDRVREAFDFFEERGYRSIIVDVRGNPGGLLDSVVDVADLFLDSGTIVSTRSRIPSENKRFTADSSTEIPETVPVIVLVDKGSASASEIFAGAMKDSGRGYLIGETTYGKGSVQWVREFGETGFKLTIARYYTPAGISVDEVGVEPDLGIPPEELSEEEQASLQQIFENNTIVSFVEENPREDPEKVDAFIDRLRNQGISLDERDIRFLVRSEYNRRMDFPPVYDLEFDKVLQRAVEMLESGEVR
ncbi:S41 family peptidase [Marispirochaeta aestuarii]|uniref:S41 family peptidase n=1 Tax=Marispirochaeta aestuarii TaxID=1963862 RepID=UPI0029C83336|nr:S41 family peptidase [Marispirochaeta aestuarii]